MIPVAGAGRPRRVDGADAAVEQRLDRRIGMGGAARIVRIVDHAGDAGVDAADRGEIIADIVVLRPVRFGEGQMRGVHVVGERRRIGIDAAQLPFPGMAVAVDEARHDDESRASITCASAALMLGRDGGDFLAFDQEIAFHEVADLGIHADDSATFEQDAVLGIDGLLAVETANIVGERRAGKPVTRGRACRQHSAGLERAATRNPHVTRHGRSSGGFSNSSGDHSSAVARKYSLSPGLILGTKSSSTFIGRRVSFCSSRWRISASSVGRLPSIE